MLEIIWQKKFPSEKQFFSFAVNRGKIQLDDMQLAILWNRHLNKMKRKDFRVHVLVELIAAQKILIEKGKPLANIAEEMRSMRLKLSAPALWAINKLLAIRTAEEMTYSHGGARTTVSDTIRKRVFELYTKGKKYWEIAEVTGLHKNTVFHILKSNK